LLLLRAQVQGLAECLRAVPPRLLPPHASEQLSAALFDSARRYWLLDPPSLAVAAASPAGPEAVRHGAHSAAAAGGAQGAGAAAPGPTAAAVPPAYIPDPKARPAAPPRPRSTAQTRPNDIPHDDDDDDQLAASPSSSPTSAAADGSDLGGEAAESLEDDAGLAAAAFGQALALPDDGGAYESLLKKYAALSARAQGEGPRVAAAAASSNGSNSSGNGTSSAKAPPGAGASASGPAGVAELNGAHINGAPMPLNGLLDHAAPGQLSAAGPSAVVAPPSLSRDSVTGPMGPAAAGSAGLAGRATAGASSTSTGSSSASSSGSRSPADKAVAASRAARVECLVAALWALSSLVGRPSGSSGSRDLLTAELLCAPGWDARGQCSMRQPCVAVAVPLRLQGGPPYFQQEAEALLAILVGFSKGWCWRQVLHAFQYGWL
jgi:hypothetical protein